MIVKNEYGVWQIDLTVNGERIRKSTKTKLKPVADKIHALLESQMLLGTHGIGKPKLTLQKAFETALQSHWKGSKAEFKVVQNWTLLSKLLDTSKDVSYVTVVVVRDLTIALAKLGNSPATINRKMAVIRTLLNLCVEWGDLTHSPKIKALKEPKSRHRVLSLSEEADMITFFAGKEEFGLFQFLLSSANRLSEALKLTWFDIDTTGCTVRFTDTKSGDTLHKPFTEVMKSVLASRRHLPVPFPYSVDESEVLWNKFRRSVNMQDDPTFVIHSLRHTCASRLVAAGVDLKRVQEWLGHKSYTTTLKYAQLSDVHLLDVVKVLNVGVSVVKEFDYSLSSGSQSKVVGFK